MAWLKHRFCHWPLWVPTTLTCQRSLSKDHTGSAQLITSTFLKLGQTLCDIIIHDPVAPRIPSGKAFKLVVFWEWIELLLVGFWTERHYMICGIVACGLCYLWYDWLVHAPSFGYLSSVFSFSWRAHDQKPGLATPNIEGMQTWRQPSRDHMGWWDVMHQTFLDQVGVSTGSAQWVPCTHFRIGRRARKMGGPSS